MAMTTITLDVPDHIVPLLDTVGDQLSLVLEMGMSRLAPVSTQAYMEAVELLTQNPTPDAVIAFRFSDEVENRIHDLLEKNKADRLNKAEEVELDRLSQLEEQLQLVKARALTNIN